VIHIEVVPSDPLWPRLFRERAALIRQALDDRAERIDHIGSTSVPGLAAKPVIDIQVSVLDLDPPEPIDAALHSLGYEYDEDTNDDRRKRFYSLDDASGRRLVNVHVRRLGEWSQQAALLFRDYLRDNPEAMVRYELEKRHLAQQDWPTVDHYANAKGDVVWALLREADLWSFHGWNPGRSDA
jgi:GrpB-like predicted nucleotidyltransferase (UPF0157 family)